MYVFNITLNCQYPVDFSNESLLKRLNNSMGRWTLPYSYHEMHIWIKLSFAYCAVSWKILTLMHRNSNKKLICFILIYFSTVLIMHSAASGNKEIDTVKTLSCKFTHNCNLLKIHGSFKRYMSFLIKNFKV